MKKILGPTFAILLVLVAIGLWYYIIKVGDGDMLKAKESAESITGGDRDQGKMAIQQYGCISCHEIPGVPGAHGLVGPSLKKFKDRAFIGGVRSNSAKNLIQWIQNPKHIDPKTAMPNLNVSEQEARDIAAYLYAPEE
jgi:cytochrome c